MKNNEKRCKGWSWYDVFKDFIFFKDPNSNTFYCQNCVLEEPLKGQDDLIAMIPRYNKTYQCGMCGVKLLGKKYLREAIQHDLKKRFGLPSHRTKAGMVKHIDDQIIYKK